MKGTPESYGPYKLRKDGTVQLPARVLEVLHLQKGESLLAWQVQREYVRLRKCYLTGQNGEGGAKVE